MAAIDRQYEHKQKLIEQAKAEFSKSKLPQSAKTSEGDSTFYPINEESQERPFPQGCFSEGLENHRNREKASDIFSTVIRDPENPRFDLEAFLNTVAAENK